MMMASMASVVFLFFIIFICCFEGLQAQSLCGSGKYWSDCDQKCQDCTEGHYCPGTDLQVPCPVGKYRAGIGAFQASDCLDCNSGEFNAEVGKAACKKCPAGFRCPTFSGLPEECAAGQFSAEGETSCTACPSGSYCPSPDKDPIQCPRGSISGGSATSCTRCTSPTQYTAGPGSSSCAACPSDSSCADPSQDPQQCPAGTYVDGGSLGICQKCPEGKECPTITGSPADCQAGYFSVGGQTQCTRCPLGFYTTGIQSTSCTACDDGKDCTDPTSNPTNCDVGTYSPDLPSGCLDCPDGTYQTAQNQVNCLDCPPGKKCPSKTAAPVDCGVGFFSNSANSTYCEQCPPGTFTNTTQAVPYTFCEPCPAGYMCSGDGTRTACSASGDYSLEGATQCQRCPAGFQCPTADSIPTLCTSGYSPAGSTACQTCPAGYSCLDPSEEPVLCDTDSGQYSESGDDNCHYCPAGKECFDQTQSPQDCSVGSYSAYGDVNCTVCPAGYACPQTTNVPKVCPLGTYSTGGATVCTPCPAGSMCPTNDAAPISCGEGSFSLGSSLTCTLCRAGFYCPSTNSSVQLPCSPGSYSAQGDSGNCTFCPAGSACPYPQSTTPITCDNGHYSEEGAIRCEVCPAGYECPSSSLPVECADGKFSNEGQSACSDCPAGMDCTVKSSPSLCLAGTYSAGGTFNCSTCDAGYICDPGSITATPSKRCVRGTYCPEGTVAALPCPAGTLGLMDAATSKDLGCGTCPAGYYCTPALNYVTDRYLCPRGHYCTENTTHSTQHPCPAGTYVDTVGSNSSAACQTCPEGFYCLEGSATYRRTPCKPGYYCPAGTERDNQYACAPGTFNSLPKQTSVAACKNCPRGYYCAGTTDTRNPASDTGFYGIVAPTICNRGSYQANAGSTGCSGCAAGFPCPYPGTSEQYVYRCHPGYYCPGSSVRQRRAACPPGTFTDRVDLTSIAQCEICPAGFACPAATGGNQPPQPCEPGYYCPGAPALTDANQIYYNSGSPYRGTVVTTEFPCPAGTYSGRNDLTSADECSACPAGHWCAGGMNRISGYCAPGHYCPERSPSPTAYPCPAGSYNNVENATNIGDCLPCPVGHYCGSGYTEPLKCPPGTYTNETRRTNMGPSDSWSQEGCMRCAAGHYCPEGSVNEVDCGPSKYSPAGAGCCRTCPAGRYCPLNATHEIMMNQTYLCPAGKWCPESTGPTPTTYANPCPLGHYCPEATTSPIDCPAGYFGPNTGLKSAAECTICPKGYYCTGGKSAPDDKCGTGHYCPKGSSSSTQIPCPGRMYRDSPGAGEEHDCNVCPNGFYCPEATTTPIDCPPGYYCIIGQYEPESCPIGSYGPGKNLKNYDDCTACPAGRYCDGIGSTSPSGLCDPGFYCKGSAFTSSPPDEPTGGLCPKGGYCVYGSSYPTTCNKGTYNNYTGGRTQEDCDSCTPGHYCAGSNRPLPSGECTGGWYCSGGAYLPIQYEAPIGYYTLDGATEPTPCPPGTYGTEKKQSSCADCPEGNYCPYTAGTNFTECPPGYYCPTKSASPTPCPEGTYAILSGLKNVSQCLSCDPGHYCQGTAKTSVTGECNPGYYCKAGSPTATPADSSDYGGRCSRGHYCPQGTVDPLPCPSGTYLNNKGRDELSDCKQCQGGRYCATNGLKSNSGHCTAGYYCIGGSATPTPVGDPSGVGDVCPAGSECPTGSSGPTPCGEGYYTDVTTQGSCFQCPKGYYCNITSGTVYPTTCPAGHYCPAGTGTNIPKCPTGSYSFQTGLENITQCLLCPGGFYCDEEALITPVNKCGAGIYCLSGASQSDGTAGVLGGKSGLCPQGRYCPEGVVQPYRCPIGTYSSQTGRTSVDDCVACPAGKYCPVTGISDPSPYNCTAGYHCISGARVPNPVDQTTGRPCTLGHYCPSGIEAPVNCTEGTYADVTGLATCLTCPKGYYCPAGSIHPPPCPKGRYCPEGTGTNQPQCPAGSYNDQLFTTNITECQLCLGGEFCSTAGLEASDGVCEAGYYCTLGATDSQGTPGILGGSSGVCPTGHYCPPKTSHPKTCPQGTYLDTTGAQNVTSCKSCTPGKYCPSTGQSSADLLCKPGFYCSGRASVEAPVDGVTGNICPTGYYCPGGDDAPIPCTEGSYTDTVGKLSCDVCPSGSYCPNITSNPIVCPTGKYCPANTQTTPPQCPAGSFTDQLGLKIKSECSLCRGGYYCSSEGMSNTGLPCDAGYFCVRGALNSTAALGELGGWGGPCPNGHYCPQGTELPINCPFGTYRQETHGQSLGDCNKCGGGKYCAGTGLSAETGNCSAGFYCPPGQFEPAPSQFICEPGYYCPTGSAHQNGCMDTTYQPSKGQDTCLTCPSGFYCRDNASTPLDCPVGYYCPNATANPIVCPNGTYGRGINYQTVEECNSCPPGRYCQNGHVVGDCEAGHICWTGNPTPNPSEAASIVCEKGCVCPNGFYCPAGIEAPVPCSNGTFGRGVGGTNSSICGDCVPGKWCVENAIEPIPCPAGKYCPNSNGINEPIPCPAGTYNPVENGAALSDCLACEAGYTCPTTGLTTYRINPCPVGHYCPAGLITETKCPAGTYNPSTFGRSLSDCDQCPIGYYCEEGTAQPIECSAGKMCWAGSGSEQPCPASFYCLKRTIVPNNCTEGFYCPEGTSDPILCPSGSYCPAGVGAPILCPAGYRTRNLTGLRTTVEDACLICEAGTFGNDTSRQYCRPCGPGHVCLTGATGEYPTERTTQQGYICPAGFRCPTGTSYEIACAKGTFNADTQFSGESCTQCSTGQFNNLVGGTRCKTCGASAVAQSDRISCTCTGEHRSYQPTDGSCICSAGYTFYKNGEDASEEDGDDPCSAIVFDRCNTGYTRDWTGKCVEEGTDACAAACGSNGGTINEDTKGICECNNLKVVEQVCDSDCLKNRLRLRINARTNVLEIYDPVTDKVVGEFGGSVVTAGSLDCVVSERCDLEVTKMKDTGFLGLYQYDLNYFSELFGSGSTTNSSSSTSKRFARSLQELLADTSTLNIDGIEQPLVCLQLGEGMVWDLTSGKTNYPQYVRDSPLNSNDNFDYSSFRTLDNLIQSNATVEMFVYMFQEAGTYVFNDAGNPSKITIIRVMEDQLSCPDAEAFKSITADALVGLSIQVNDPTLLTPDYLLIGVLLGAFVMLIIMLMAGVHFFRTRTWRTLSGSKPRYKKKLIIGEVEGKDKLGPDGLPIVDEDKKVDMEGFNVKSFYDILTLQNRNVFESLDDFKSALDGKYEQILEETALVKQLLGKKQQDIQNTIKVNIDEYLKPLHQVVSNQNDAKKIIKELKDQLKGLRNDRDAKVRFKAKLYPSLNNSEISKLKDLDEKDYKNRDEVIKAYNLFINKLEDIVPKMENEDEKAAKKAINKFNNTLDHTKKMIDQALTNMNSTIEQQDAILVKNKPKNSFNLDQDTASQLKLFIKNTLTELFQQFKEEEDLEKSDNEEEEDGEDNKEDEDDGLSDVSDTDTEPDTEEDEEWTEEEKLESNIRKRHRKLRSKQKDEILNLDDEIDAEFIEEKESITQFNQDATEKAIKLMKDDLRKNLDSGRYDEDQQAQIVKESRRAMDRYKSNMKKSQDAQIQQLTRLMEKKKSQKRKILKQNQHAEREFFRKTDVTDRKELKNLLKKLDNSEISDAKDRELNRQKELMKFRLENRRNNRAKQQVQQKIVLKELIDEYDKIDQDVMKQRNELIDNMRVENVRENNQAIAESSHDKQKILSELNKNASDMQNSLKSQRAKEEAELKEKLQKRRDKLNQQLENRHSLEEQSELKQQEKDLKAMRKIMLSSYGEGEGLSIERSNQRKRHEEELRKRLSQMSSKRAESKMKIEKQAEKEMEKITNLRETELAKIKKKFTEDVAKKIQNKEDTFKVQIESAQLEKEEKDRLLDVHKKDIEEFKSKMDLAQKKHIEELNKRIEDRMKRVRMQVREKEMQDLKNDLIQQEKLIDKVARVTNTVGRESVQISKKDRKKESALQKTNDETMERTKEDLERDEHDELTLYQKELKISENKRSLVVNHEKARKALESMKQQELAASKESEKTKILSKYEDELTMLKGNQDKELRRQEEGFEAKLAQKRELLKKKKEDKLLKLKKEQRNKEKEMRAKHLHEAEKKKILDLLMDDNRKVNTIEDAVNKVVLGRQDEEMNELLAEQKKEVQSHNQDDKKGLNRLQFNHTERRVEMKKHHLKERADLAKEFSKYKELLRKGNEEQKALEEELERFQDHIKKQKELNLGRIEKQKKALREEMQKQLDEETAKAKTEAAALEKKLKAAKNNFAVDNLIREHEKQKEELLKQQKNLETDEREKLLAEHKLSMGAFQDALEAERLRQEKILQNRMDGYSQAEKKKQQEETYKKLNAEFTGKRLKPKNEDKEGGLKSKKGSIITLVKNDTLQSTSMDYKKIREATSIFTGEHRWAAGIYRRIKNIESRVEGNQNPYMDSGAKTEGKKVIIPIESLSLPQTIVFRFGEFITKLLRYKFRSIPEVRLLIASSLNHNEYKHNAFRNSFEYDANRRTLFIRKTRLDTVGKFVLTLVHCLAHISCGKFVHDSNPAFLRLFYEFLSCVSEDVFSSRQLGKHIPSQEDHSKRQQISQDLLNYNLSLKSSDAFIAELEKLQIAGPPAQQSQAAPQASTSQAAPTESTQAQPQPSAGGVSEEQYQRDELAKAYKEKEQYNLQLQKQTQRLSTIEKHIQDRKALFAKATKTEDKKKLRDQLLKLAAANKQEQAKLKALSLARQRIQQEIQQLEKALKEKREEKDKQDEL